jgi:outer membrane biosynthesis protein TonB
MVARVSPFLMICTLLAAPAVWAEEAPEVSVAIVPTKAKGGPNLKGQVRKRIENKLKADLQVVSFKTYRKAARRAGIKGKAAFDRANAVQAGTEAGVTHVCFIEGQREKEGRKSFFFAEVNLIEVSSGEVVFTKRYELQGRKINAVIAGGMLEELTAALTTPPAPPEPVEELVEEPVEELPAPPEAPPPVAAEEEPLVAASPTDMPATDADPPLEEATATAALTPPLGDTTAITVTEPISPRKRKRWRHALHAGIGGTLVYRLADLKADNGEPPGYEGPLPGACLKLDFFPMAIGGRGEWYEGFGIHLEGQYMRVDTVIDSNTKETVTSDIYAANGGLSFRLVFWSSETAPDFTFKGGYGLFIFPLRGTFPGTRYLSPYAGGHLTVPFVEEVALIVGGHLNYPVNVEGKLKNKMGTFDSGLGFRADLGVRLFFDPIEIVAMSRYERWETQYTGTTSLVPGSAGYDNVSMEDQMVSGYITAGVAF